MTITSCRSKSGDEFHIHLNDTDAQFLLAALLRKYPTAMFEALVDLVNKTDTEEAVAIQVEAVASEGGKNLPLDKFCLDSAIKLLVAKKSLSQPENEEPTSQSE